MPTVWVDWCTTGATTTTVTDCTIWPQWTSTTTTTTGAWTTWTGNTTTPAPPRSERDRLIQANRHHASRLRARVAARRAEALLVEHLDEQQQREWAEGKAFHVETADGRRRYRIKLGLAGNVALVRDGDREAQGGRSLRRYCMHVYHPEGFVPHEDNVLAQKLLIEANEAEFLRLANVM